MKTKDIVRIVASIIIIAAILIYLYTSGYFEIVNSIKWSDWIVLIGLTLLSYFVAGVQFYYLVKYANGTKISISEILFMPMSMNMFGYLIPTNGGFLYAVYFLKKKYQVETSKGFSVGVFSIYIAFIISGLSLLVAVILLKSYSIYLILLSVILILSPIIVHFMNVLVQKIPARQETLAGKAKNYLNSVVVQSNKMMLNKSAMLINIVLTILWLALLFLMYYQLNHVLMINLSLLSIIALIVLMRISGLIRFLPGNLGLEELLTAGVFGIIGNDPSVGLVFSVFLRFCAVIIMIPIGITHTAVNSKYFSIRDLKKILKRKE